jgi:hypothetical protein
MTLSIEEISFIATVLRDQDSIPMPLVILPVPFILNIALIFGISHLAFTYSFSIAQLADVETFLLVLFDSVIYSIVAFILSVLNVLLVICQVTTTSNSLSRIIVPLFFFLILRTLLLFLLLMRLRRPPRCTTDS